MRGFTIDRVCPSAKPADRGNAIYDPSIHKQRALIRAVAQESEVDYRELIYRPQGEHESFSKLPSSNTLAAPFTCPKEPTDIVHIPTLENAAMHNYDEDIAAWADEQAQLLRASRFDQLDVAHLADEIEGVGKSEERDLADHLAVLMAHLLQWQYQADRRSASWKSTIRAQRASAAYVLHTSPSLVSTTRESRWLGLVWQHALARAINETGLNAFPEQCPWSLSDQVLRDGWLPD